MKKGLHMKILLFFLATVFIIFVVVQSFALYSQWNIETYPYKLVRKYDRFEERSYETTIFTSL